jgi:pyruvate/2-oxoglutarate dehydrogenase complex dihydrolipoamide dehydrogenase (E3) component
MLLRSVRNAGYKTMPQASSFPVMKNTMLPAGTFDNKVAFITGGGTGLGKGMATHLSSLGATVAITGRRESVLKATADEITEKTGNQVVFAPCDVRDAAAVKVSKNKYSHVYEIIKGKKYFHIYEFSGSSAVRRRPSQCPRHCDQQCSGQLYFPY